MKFFDFVDDGEIVFYADGGERLVWKIWEFAARTEGDKSQANFIISFNRETSHGFDLYRNLIVKRSTEI